MIFQSPCFISSGQLFTQVCATKHYRYLGGGKEGWINFDRKLQGNSNLIIWNGKENFIQQLDSWFYDLFKSFLFLNCNIWAIWGATQKFPKFFCHSLTTYQNFYSPPSPSKQSPFAWIQQSQWDFHDRRHCWKSFCVSVFITSVIHSGCLHCCQNI